MTDRHTAGTCTCGHPPGSHRTVTTGDLRVLIGICLVEGCDCRKFIPARRVDQASGAVAARGHQDLDQRLDDTLGSDDE